MYSPYYRRNRKGYPWPGEKEALHRLLLFLLIIPTIFWFAGALDDY
ncbi:hypothetical protein [Paludifilum halophilum]|nr:hypothetical protein [Paludifilum halophilum]